METKDYLDLLGKQVKDRVTGAEGVVTSISFDLYGCVQALVNPGLDKDCKLRDSWWFDTNRLDVKKAKRVMNPPRFVDVGGPEAKPMPPRQ